MCESGTDFVPIAEAARLLETTETVVLQMLNNNELQGKKVTETWSVDRLSLGLYAKPKTAETVISGGCGICGNGCGSGC